MGGRGTESQLRTRWRPRPTAFSVHTQDGHTTILTGLDQVGFVGAPRHLGVDEQGRDMFSYVPGDTLGAPVCTPELHGRTGRRTDPSTKHRAPHPPADRGMLTIHHADPPRPDASQADPTDQVWAAPARRPPFACGLRGANAPIR